MDYFAQLTDSILKLVGIDSVQATACELSPFGMGVGRCLNQIVDWSHAMSFDAYNKDGYYAVTEIGQGKPFGILGHIDTVPYDDYVWSANPLGELRDGVLYGRGVLDDKGPMLCCLYAIKQLIDEGYRPTRRIRMIWGGNEETGWKCIEHYNACEAMPPEGFSPDGDFPAIYCEKGLVHYDIRIPMPKGLRSIRGGSRGNVVMPACEAVYDGKLTAPASDDRLRVTVTGDKTYLQAEGTPAHASTPKQGDNALWHILRYLAKAVGEPYASFAKTWCHDDGKGLEICLHDTKSGNLTCNVGVIRSDEDGLHILLDVRHPVSYTREDVRKRIVHALGVKDADVTVVHYHDPLYVDPDHPLMQSLLHSYTQVTGQPAKPIAIGGGTYARALPVGVAFGPIFPDMESTIHQKDERVSLDSLRKMYQIYYTAIRALCFAPKED